MKETATIAVQVCKCQSCNQKSAPLEGVADTCFNCGKANLAKVPGETKSLEIRPESAEQYREMPGVTDVQTE